MNKISLKRTIRNSYLFRKTQSLQFLIDKKLNYFIHKNKFYKKVGYRLNLNNPQSFNEKIVWKKIHDRNSFLPLVADKYRVRFYIENVLGKENAKKILIPQLFVTENAKKIPFDRLPKDFVIKANHGSGTSLFIENGKFDKKEIIKRCKEWLNNPYGLTKHEWAYQKIDRKIVIEKMMKSERGDERLKDYKFYVFNGKCYFIFVNFESHTPNWAISIYDKNWKILPVSVNSLPTRKKIKKPKHLKEMISLAEKLGKKFDFVRVDLYYIKNKIYFGELTHYPWSGMARFNPRKFDFELGKIF